MIEALTRGYYPHQLSRLLDNPLRRLLIRPETIADRLELRADMRVIEVGPGSGYFSREIARRLPAGRLELLDLQPEMLEKARRTLAGRHSCAIGYTAADACRPLSFPAASFDRVLLVAVLGELPDRPAALAEFRRILRPGGMLAVHEHLPDPDMIGFVRLRGLIEPAGFGLTARYGRRWNYTALFTPR